MLVRFTITRLAIVVVLLLLAAPITAAAQSAGKVPRIGVLSVGNSPEPPSPVHALREGLRESGYIEGQSVVIEWRWAEGKAERFPELASELVRLNVDVIVAGNDPAIAATQKATTTIPIVMVLASDPVRRGFVASLARPGRNVTGLTVLTTELAGKHLQILKETLPTLSRVAVLRDPSEPGGGEYVREAEVAARALGIQLQLVEARSAGELEDAFVAMVKGRAGAALIRSSAMLFVHRARIAELAMKSRLPTMAHGEYVKAGCLLSYSPNFHERFRRAAYFVDRILKGAKPADLPVEQPTKLEMVVNLKTAKALHLIIPPSLLLRADRIIE